MLAILCAPRAGGAAVVSPLEEKVRYERSLEAKAEAILSKVLGSDQARIAVEATLKLEEAPGSGKKSETQQTQFAWLNAAQKREKLKELLPGFNSPAPVSPMDEEEARTYSYKVSMLNVTIVVGKELPAPVAANVSDLVSRVLGLDPGRGDTLDVVKMDFVPAWKSLLDSPEYIGMFLRYGLISLVTIISFLIIGLGIARLAGAMGQAVRSQEHEVSIGFNGGGAETPEIAGKPAAGRDLPQEGDSPRAEPERSGGLVFNVSEDQVPLLAGMLKNEDPENISLVVYHLPDKVRAALLTAIGSELATRVIAQLARVRFVDREMIAEIKEELEKRLDSAVGGVNKAVELISPMPYSARREMIERFGKLDPQLASELRREFIFEEDLLSLSDKEIGILVSALPLSQWAEVFPGLAEALRLRLKSQMAERAVQMIEQTMKYAVADKARTDEALEGLMKTVWTLVKDGRISRPAVASGALTAGAQEGPAASAGPAQAAGGKL